MSNISVALAGWSREWQYRHNWSNYGHDMRHIRIWVYDGILASTVAGPIDVFAVANAVWADQARAKAGAAPLFDWHVESPDGKPVRTAAGYPMAVDGPIGARAASDAVIVVGPFVGRGPAQFAERFDGLLPALQSMLVALRRRHERGTLVASVCGGSFLLAEAGLLDGRAATTHWGLAETFRKRYPRVKLRADEVITEDDNILCSGAVTSYLNLALRLVEKFAGTSLAATTGKMLLIDTNRISQASYRTLTVQDRQPHADPLVARAQLWMEKHLHERFQLADLASHLAASVRTVSRRFRQAIGETPLGHLQSLRVERAKLLLETTGLTVDAIAERIGYDDLSTLRRLFKRKTGLSPREYQRRFTRAKRAERGL